MANPMEHSPLAREIYIALNQDNILNGDQEKIGALAIKVAKHVNTFFTVHQKRRRRCPSCLVNWIYPGEGKICEGCHAYKDHQQ